MLRELFFYTFSKIFVHVCFRIFPALVNIFSCYSFICSSLPGIHKPLVTLAFLPLSFLFSTEIFPSLPTFPLCSLALPACSLNFQILRFFFSSLCYISLLFSRLSFSFSYIPYFPLSFKLSFQVFDIAKLRSIENQTINIYHHHCHHHHHQRFVASFLFHCHNRGQ